MLEKKYPVTMAGIEQAATDLDVTLADVPAPVKAAVMVAADEIFANIVRHSNASYWSLRVDRMHAPEGVRLVFEDDGAEFDPLKMDDPDISLSVDQRPVGGLGIFIVKKTMCPVVYERKDGKNVFSMTKSFERT